MDLNLAILLKDSRFRTTEQHKEATSTALASILGHNRLKRLFGCAGKTLTLEEMSSVLVQHHLCNTMESAAEQSHALVTTGFPAMYGRYFFEQVTSPVGETRYRLRYESYPDLVG